MNLFRSGRALILAALSVCTVIVGGASGLLGVCGPFMDVSDAQFCPFVLEIFTLGITTGTTPTTYDPTSAVSRLQMAAFLSRSVDGVLKRGSRRAALDQFWTPQNPTALGLTTLGAEPAFVKSDGSDVWAAGAGLVSRVRGSDGRLLETWTGATNANGIEVAMGMLLVAGGTIPGQLYRIDPSQLAGGVTTVASNLGGLAAGIAFDGARFWTSNQASVSIVTPTSTIPWTVTTVTTGFSKPQGILYDGANVWVTDRITGSSPGSLLKLDSAGTVLQTVTVGLWPLHPAFDGANIWVPNTNSLAPSISVVRASTGSVLATLTGNGMLSPGWAAFDGQRVLVTDFIFGPNDGASLWRAADLSPLGFVLTGPQSEPVGVCSDGVNFWIALNGKNQLARF